MFLLMLFLSFGNVYLFCGNPVYRISYTCFSRYPQLNNIFVVVVVSEACMFSIVK